MIKTKGIVLGGVLSLIVLGCSGGDVTMPPPGASAPTTRNDPKPRPGNTEVLYPFTYNGRDGYKYLEFEGARLVSECFFYVAGSSRVIDGPWNQIGFRGAWQIGYKDGHLDGPQIMWYPDGKLRTRGQYQGGAKHGRWERYNEDGSLDSDASGIFEGGQRTAPLEQSK